MHSDGTKDNPVCGFCGGIVPPNFWYCTHCGADLKPVDATPAELAAGEGPANVVKQPSDVKPSSTEA